MRPLYQRCAAFVFPSMYEGFGLPILEAMHCGAPVIAGNNSSQIEVVGDAGVLFNVADAGELAGHLARLLGEPERAREMGERAAVQARRFSWETTADKALEVPFEPERAGEIDSRVAEYGQTGAPRSMLPSRRSTRPAAHRIAFFSPLPPSASEVVGRLGAVAGRADAALRDRPVPRCRLLAAHRPADPRVRLLRLPAVRAQCQASWATTPCVYQMGNSHYHGYMYETLLRHPGIVTLHDLGLAGLPVLVCPAARGGRGRHIRREFEAYCGAEADEACALAASAEAAGGMPAACVKRGNYLNGRILEQATAVVVHSPWCVEQVRSRFPDHVDKISVVASGATALDPSAEERKAIRARFGMPPEALIIASVGRMHPTRMNAETIAAFAPLARAIPEALLIFAGTEHDNGEARRKAMELGLQHRVRFLGHHPADVLADMAAIADIGVCLRRPPTNGETSAALMDLLRLGVPTIVSDVGPLSCYPDSVVRKHPLGHRTGWPG